MQIVNKNNENLMSFHNNFQDCEADMLKRGRKCLHKTCAPRKCKQFMNISNILRRLSRCTMNKLLLAIISADATNQLLNQHVLEVKPDKEAE